ncbi:hypothetical protein KWG64_06365 [Rahnella sp. PD12R]|uniref:hypothetical protein n=1 Tax=Rahnella sp. PD12R TaxID=2855688 RepID=UPI001C43A21E|nr:hypothetical protein [Rahnella sp. PD12R]MBV6817564.1 hypothetical protein [Rahnella sp. PD12R]
MRISPLALMLIPALSFASLKDFDLEVMGQHLTIPASCINKVQNNENEEAVNSGVYLEIASPCSEPLSDLTKMNIGKTMTISYGGQLVQKATIASRLSNGFMFNINGGNMMVIRQIVADSEAK